MKNKIIFGLAIAGLGLAAALPARAGLSVSFGIPFPVPPVIVGRPPVVVTPPVIYSPAPVVSCPAPVVVATPPPVYVAPPCYPYPVYRAGYGYGYYHGYRHVDYHHGHRW